MDYVTLGVELGIVAVPFLLPNQVVEKVGYATGKVLSTVLRQKIGKDNTLKVEGYIKGTVSHFVEGLTNGMDSE